MWAGTNRLYVVQEYIEQCAPPAIASQCTRLCHKHVVCVAAEVPSGALKPVYVPISEKNPLDKCRHYLAGELMINGEAWGTADADDDLESYYIKNGLQL